jgi:hypothetical protein
MDPRDKQKIIKLLTGGAAAGTSVGLSIALANFLNSLSKETKTQTGADDDVLYIDLPADGTAKKATASTVVGLTGAVLTGLGSLALVREIQQRIKQRELQQRLDNAQVAYTQRILEEAEAQKTKKASNAPGSSIYPGDAAFATPIAGLLLTMLASGALTYKGLNKYFPGAKPPKSIGPKRVVVRRKATENPEEATEEDMPEDDMYKASSMDDDALESLVKIAMSNSSTHSDLRDIVHAVAQGRHQEICEHGLSLGVESMFDVVKSASSKATDASRIQMAVTRCVKSAYLRPIVETLACAEFYDMAPASVKLASSFSEESRDALVKIASILGTSDRYSFWSEKLGDAEFSKVASMALPAVDDPELASLLDESLFAEDPTQTPINVETESEMSESQSDADEAYEDQAEDARDAEREAEDEDAVDSLMGSIVGGEGQWAENKPEDSE